MSTQAVAEKMLRLAKAKDVRTDAIVAAIYAGMSEAEIIAADSDRPRDLLPRTYGRREPKRAVTRARAPEPTTKHQPIRM
jgi:hypothetical protein